MNLLMLVKLHNIPHRSRLLEFPIWLCQWLAANKDVLRLSGPLCFSVRNQMLGILPFDVCMELARLIFAEMNNPPCLTLTDQTNVPRVPCEFKP